MGYAVQTATGFGAAVVATALGALFLPVERIAPLMVPVSLLQNAWVLAAEPQAVDRRVLLREILPWMGGALPVGALLAGGLATDGLRTLLGGLLLALVAYELTRARPAPTWLRRGGLIGAGVVHGLLATGGPLLVWSIGQLPLEPKALRSTLTAVWFVLGLVLLAVYALDGRLTAEALLGSAWLIPSVPLGIGLGEGLLRRLPPEGFRALLRAVLLAAGLVLLAR
jgi:hypothetical protein